jgi:murein DD-endopeptidase MepM/ murein hydrolase activator NlpD
VRYTARHRRSGTPGPPLVPIVAGLVVLPVAVALAVSSGIGRSVGAGGLGADRPSARSGAEIPGLVPLPPATSEAPDPRLVAFASWRSVELHLLSADVRCVCYHEASYRDAMALQPMGRMRRNYNITKFPQDEPRTEGPDYVIMSSRGRGTPATSAVDLVMPRRTQVLAPVTGVVVRVRRYRLYGSHLDIAVEIRPDSDHGVRVSMIHLDDPQVREGDRVEQGLSPIGVPRAFPFGDQTDLYIPGGHPHVHVEIIDLTRTK